MLIIVDKKIPEAAKLNLQNYGHLLEFETSGITYAAISGHPDIFFTDGRLFAAANLPVHYLEILRKHHVDIETGQHGVEMTYPGSARYNAVATNELLVHNIAITDSRITEAAANKKIVHVHQGYTRCNLIFLSARHGIETLFFRPEGIELPGFDYGFFGGACGLWNKKLFLTGNPDHHPDGNKLRSFASNAGVEIISLCNRTLFDGGGIFFIRAM